ncbi:MAG: hypothetical protein ABL907_07495 [Hyphomicrobium sp.]
MPIYWWLNAEVRSSGGWKIPPELPAPDMKNARDIGGEFGWMKQDYKSARLFFGNGALFPFRRGRPPGASEFCRLWDTYQPDWDIDMDAHWIDFEQLYIDLWDTPAVLMHSLVSARFARLFGDGSHSLPEAALRAAGATDNDFTKLRENAGTISDTIDTLHGWDSFAIERMPPQEFLGVTWQASVNWMVPGCADRIRELRRLGNDTDLRVIALRG